MEMLIMTNDIILYTASCENIVLVIMILQDWIMLLCLSSAPFTPSRIHWYAFEHAYQGIWNVICMVNGDQIDKFPLKFTSYMLKGFSIYYGWALWWYVHKDMGRRPLFLTT